MSFEQITGFLLNKKSQAPEKFAAVPSTSVNDPDKKRVLRNEFARLTQNKKV